MHTSRSIVVDGKLIQIIDHLQVFGVTVNVSQSLQVENVLKMN